jgi:hypothetical protein
MPGLLSRAGSPPRSTGRPHPCSRKASATALRSRKVGCLKRSPPLSLRSGVPPFTGILHCRFTFGACGKGFASVFPSWKKRSFFPARWLHRRTRSWRVWLASEGRRRRSGAQRRPAFYVAEISGFASLRPCWWCGEGSILRSRLRERRLTRKTILMPRYTSWTQDASRWIRSRMRSSGLRRPSWISSRSNKRHPAFGRAAESGITAQYRA